MPANLTNGRTLMSTLFNRQTLAPLWVGAVLGLFTLVGSPLTPAIGSLLLLMAIAPPTILLILSTAPPLTLSGAIAEELHPVRRCHAPVSSLDRTS